FQIVGRVVRVTLAEARLVGAVAVAVLDAVAHRAVVGVGAQRVGGGVGVGVGHEDRFVGVVALRGGQAALGAVLDAVAVGVGIQGIGLVVVEDAVVVGVLGAVEEPVVIGVVVARVGLVGGDGAVMIG